MKKKILSILITVLSLCMCMFTLTACGENEPPHTHTYSVLKYDTENHWYECSCGEKKDIENHKGGTATETNKATCSVCNQEYGESLGHVHTLHLTKVDEKPQSCTATGNIEYYTCSCGKWFTDNTATTEITDKTSVVIAKDAHKYETLKKTATEHWWECSCGDKDGLEEHHGGIATCTQKAVCNDCGTEYGSKKSHSYTELKQSATQHWYECICGAYETKENHIPGAVATETTDQKCTECNYVIAPALGHVHTLHLTKVDAKPQSCTKEGNREYYTCSCGKWFTDNTAATEITDKDSVVIEKDDHKYETLKKTDTEHWWECSCGANETKENHKGGTATCKQKATCSVCDTFYGDFAEHEPKTAWVIADTHHYHECVYGCTVKLNYSEHSFTNYKSNNDATYESDGTKTAQCDGGCGETHTVTDVGSMLIKDEIRFTTLTVDGKNVYGKVSNATTEFVFYEEIFVSGNATYVVDNDKSCSSPIDSKTVDLVVGDNTFYVLETVGNNVKLYTVTIHRREMFTVTFNTNGGTAVDSQIVEEDSFATAPTTTKTGYTFTGWDYDFTTPIIKDTTITASWIESTNTAYKVEYYLENLENDNYSILITATENLTGTTNSTVYAEIKTFEHFTAEQNSVSGVINANGTTIIKVYYQRNIYTLSTNNSSAGSITNLGSYKYGNSITTKIQCNLGYTFIGWYSGGNLLSTETTYTYNADKNVTATFELNEEMQPFTFTSTKTTCVITGIKDKTIKEIVVPNYATAISSGAFIGCSSLESITLPFLGASATACNGYDQVFGYIFGYTTTSSSSSISGATYQYKSGSTYYHYYIPTSLTSITIGNSVKIIGENAFWGCGSLTKVNYLGTIDQWAQIEFSNGSSNPLSYAKNLYINNVLVTEAKITTAPKINSYAFYDYDSLTSVTIGNSVASIGSYAFYGCNRLVEVYNLSSLNIEKNGYNGHIGYYAFDIYTSLDNPSKLDNQDGYIIHVNDTEITLVSYTGIGTDLTLPNSVTSIGDYAFYNCDSLTSIEIPNSVTSIGGSAFSNCDSLSSVVMGDSVTSIGNYAFYRCTSLTSVAISTSVKKIGDNAFESCRLLTSIEIPSSVESIGSLAFHLCSSLTEVNYLGTIDQWAQIKFSNGSSNPLSYAKNLYINNVLVTEAKITIAPKINSYAFYGCDSLTSVTIGNSITSIGSQAFYGCSILEEINFNATSCSDLGNLDEVFENAGQSASGIVVTFGDNVKHIPAFLFYTHWDSSVYPKIIRVVIGDSVESIGSLAFGECESLTSVTIGNSVESIGYGAFQYCSSLTSVVIGDSVKSIGDGAFGGCDSLTSIEIPNSVESIGKNAFYGCSSLESIKLPFVGATLNGTSNMLFGYIFGASGYGYNDDNVPTTLKEVIITGGTSIGSSAFDCCDSLTSIEIPSSVTNIGEYAFRGCGSLTKVKYMGTIDEWVQIEFGGSYANPLCNGASLYISNVLVTEANITTATKINNYAFYDYDSLTSVIIGNNVTSIGKCAFSRCSSLESIEIPNSVTSIENNAFYRCDSLARIVIPDSVTNIGEYALASCSSLQSITYIGTVEEWDNVSKGSNWSSKIQATQVVCSDGTVNI